MVIAATFYYFLEYEERNRGIIGIFVCSSLCCPFMDVEHSAYSRMLSSAHKYE